MSDARRPAFADFDRRGYRTVGVREGYGEWAPTYEDTVQDAMDVALLAELNTVHWSDARDVADLGCGTGRTAAWLRSAGVGAVDGVDLTPQMLDRARALGMHRRLVEADVTDTQLASEAYDLVVSSLVDEHLADVAPLYAEARRIARRGAAFVLIGYHPHFIMAAGMPTHFDGATGEPIAIATFVHPFSEHVAAALRHAWQLAEMRERFIDDEWLRIKPKWSRFRGHPISYALVWRKS